MMMNAFWWEFIKMKVKLGILRIIDLIYLISHHGGRRPAFKLMITFWRIGKSDVLIQEKFTLDTVRDAGWAFWWLRSRIGGQEAWLKLELFKNLWLLKKTYTRTCFIRNIFLAWSRNIDVLKEINSFQPHLGRHGRWTRVWRQSVSWWRNMNNIILFSNVYIESHRNYGIWVW